MYKNFDLLEVKLRKGVFYERRELVKNYLRELSVERLMYNFKINSGLKSEFKPYGGWEAPDCGLRGHFVGHYLSACSKFAYSDCENDLVEKVKEIVKIMKECQREDGYLSAFPENDIDKIESEEDRGAWAPYYTLHKILQGLLDAYHYLNIVEALNIALKLGYYIKRRFESLSYWKIDGVLRCTKLNPKNEFGGIGDCLYTMYEYTKDSDMLELAKVFDRDYFLEPLEKGKDILCNLHSNTHLSMILSALHRYEISGEERYKDMAFTFYEFLRGRVFANGNSSSKAPDGIEGKTSSFSEHWGEYGDLTDKLTGGECESCCAHNTEKILSKLFRYRNDIRYLDHIEKLKYNSVLNSSSSLTGLSQYQQPMCVGARKKFSTKEDTFWCCTGTGIEAMSELAKDIYFIDKNKILVNCFISSEAVIEGVRLIQESSYPDELVSKIRIENAIEEETIMTFVFKTAHINQLFVNNQKYQIDMSGDYVEITRSFATGDVITINIKAELEIEYLKGSHSVGAIRYGSILLAQLGEREYIRNITKKNLRSILKKEKSSDLKFFILDEENRKVEFVPVYKIEDQQYTVYMNLVKQDEKM